MCALSRMLSHRHLLQLRTKIVRHMADKERLQRQKILSRYIPNAASAIHTVLQVTRAQALLLALPSPVLACR